MEADWKLSYSLSRWKRDKVLFATEIMFHLDLLQEIFKWDLSLQETSDRIKGKVPCLIFVLWPQATAHRLHTLKKKKTQEGYWWWNTWTCLAYYITCVHHFLLLRYNFCFTLFSLSFSTIHPHRWLFLLLLSSFSFFSFSRLLNTYSPCLDLLQCQHPTLN